MSEIRFYPSGRPCPHCIWIANDPKISAKFRWGQMNPFAIIPPYKNFIGVTVFDSHGFFKNTFNCVNGVRGANARISHDFRNIGSLLYGATIFIENLHINFGVKNVRLLINSNFDKKKHGSKEHPHALITVSDQEEKVFDSIEEMIGKKQEKAKNFVASEPYKGDTIVELSPQDCAELIRSGGGAMENIAKKLSSKLGYDFDPISNNFYVFLSYECIDSSRPRCGVIHGKISTDLQPKL